MFISEVKEGCSVVGVINYDLIWRRPELKGLKNISLLLDESSLIRNDSAKRTKFILSLNVKNVILLSGTPADKYEQLYSQLKLLGWNISKRTYWNTYVTTTLLDLGGNVKIPVVTGYKNVDRLKEKMREHGCHFLKTEDVFELPSQTDIRVTVEQTSEYKKFRKSRLITVDGREMVGDNSLNRLLYERMLCGSYNKNKLKAFEDLLESTNDRLLVFYNFKHELEALRPIAEQFTEHISVVNGDGRDLKAYEQYEDSITFIQYQAGSMGLNLQKANKIIYFSPTLSCEQYLQSRKRTNRIGQDRPCFYYLLTVKGSVEEKIYKSLELGRDYTLALFEEGTK
jgi:SNF2 family DNA or RNA helicase